MKNYTFSILIITLNRVNETKALLNSLKKQSYKEFEIVIVDNNSSKNLAETIIKEYPEVNLTALNENLGVPGARNIAIKKAKGNYLVFLDNDTEVKEDFLKITLENFNLFPSASIFACNILKYNTKKIDFSSSIWTKEIHQMSTPLRVSSFVGAGFVAKKNIFNDYGYFWDKLFFMHEEKELALRLLKANKEIFFNPNMCVFHKSSNLNRIEYNQRNYYYGVRNNIWIIIRNYPIIKAIYKIIFILVSGFLYSIKNKSFMYYLNALSDLFLYSKEAFKNRDPLNKKQIDTFYSLSHKDRTSLSKKIKNFLL